MPPASRSSRGPNIVVGIGLLLLATIYAAWVWSGELTEFGGDSAAYLLMARYYSPYHAASAAVLAYKTQLVAPPLFPWMLAIVDGGYHLLAAHLVVAFFATSAAAVLYLWLRNESLSIFASAVATLIFAAMPATLLQIFNIWTEFPFIFFSLGAIALLARAEASPSLRFWSGAAVLVACASLTRAASLPLIASFVCFLLYKHPRRFLWIGLVAILPFTIWVGYSGHSETGAGAYVNHFLDVYSSDPIDKFIRQLRSECGAIAMAWQSGWIGTSLSPVLHALILGFGLICLGGWLHRLWSLRFDAIYVSLYLVLLLVWPHPEEASRYSFVLNPILIAHGFLLLSHISQYMRGPSGRVLIVGVVGGVLIIPMLPTLIFYGARFFEATPNELAFAKHASNWYNGNLWEAQGNAQFRPRLTQSRLFQHLKEIDRFVPVGDCIFSIKPTVITLYADRSSYTPPKISDDDMHFGTEIKKCRFAYLLPFASPSFGRAFYPLDRLSANAKILTKIDNERGKMDGALIEITPKLPYQVCCIVKGGSARNRHAGAIGGKCCESAACNVPC